MTDKHKKRREAAIKAWETIRQKKREKQKHTEKLTTFINIKEVGDILHPEVINGKYEIWRGNGVIKPFEKTPSNIACGPFWEIRWAYGCPLNCSYCYLRGTTRGHMKPSYVRIEETDRCIQDAFQNIKDPSIFNSGELCDSLMNPPLMKKIVDIFEQQSKHKIYLLSKFGSKNIDFLLGKHRKQVICGWSVNAEDVAKKWEVTAPKPSERIKAAQKVWEAGYDTRIRIDPIFPVENWDKHYGQLIENIFSAIWPNRIILGT